MPSGAWVWSGCGLGGAWVWSGCGPGGLPIFLEEVANVDVFNSVD